MHPPSFYGSNLLTDWPNCFIEVHCGPCRNRTCVYPVKLLISRFGNQRILDVLTRFKCKDCGEPPAPIYLCASHHRQGGTGGPRPDWALELRPGHRLHG
jgi:ribosomal protein S27E